MKVFLGVHKFACNEAVEADMGWFPNSITRTINLLRFWNRLIKLDNDRLTKKVFLHEYRVNRRGSWCFFVKRTLASIGMGHIYTHLQECDLALCRQRLQELYILTWSTNVNKKPKLRTFVQLKLSYKTEAYVKLNLERNQRSILGQLRTGTLPLHIETGRFENKRVEERVCRICNNGEVETECHFVFHCSYYDDARNDFFSKCNSDMTNLTDEAKLCYLF